MDRVGRGVKGRDSRQRHRSLLGLGPTAREIRRPVAPDVERARSRDSTMSIQEEGRVNTTWGWWVGCAEKFMDEPDGEFPLLFSSGQLPSRWTSI
jgi:hypothetical protein